ncbi:MAG: sugar ABC transporter [Desulfobacterium sp.]|nr:sugar ABC transporter [Desulfobacterium sp.]
MLISKKIFCLSILIALMLSLNVGNVFCAEKTIYAIESYHAEYPWDASYKSGLEESLGGKYKIVYFQMDTKRLPKNQHQRMAGLAWEKYLLEKPALVIIGDDAGLKLLGPKFAETSTPVVFLGINNNPRNYFTSWPTNITGVLERPLLKRSILNINKILPNTKRVLVLFDSDITAQITKKEVFNDQDSLYIKDIKVEIRLIGDLQTWQNTVLSSKGKYDACVVGLYQSVKDADGKPVNSEELIAWTSKNTPIPPFAFWDFAIGRDKTIGGLVLFGKEMGVLASGLVLKILEKGKTPKELFPIMNDQGILLFSKSQLTKWNIKLPENMASTAGFID